MKNIASATTKERFPLFPQLLLTFDIFYIPHVHLARNHGANIHEEAAESLSEATRPIRPQKQWGGRVKPAAVYRLRGSGVSKH